MIRKKINLDVRSTLADGMSITWQERNFIFNLALLPAFLIGLFDITTFLPNFPKNNQIVFFVFALCQWVIGLPFVVGWILFLHGRITRRDNIFHVFKKYVTIWRFMWRNIIFSILLLLVYGAVTSLLFLSAKITPLATNEKISLSLLLLPAVFIAPFFFLSMIDFVLNKKFQPFLLLQHAFHSYGKIFLTLWILAFFFLGIVSGCSIILGVGFATFGIDDVAVLQKIIQNSIALSFILSFLGNMFFFWLSTCAYNIAYRYWQDIN